MCLGLPGRIISVMDGGNVAQAEVVGVVRAIDLSLLSDDMVEGDRVLIHSGCAVQRLSPEQANEIERQFAAGDAG